MKNHLKKFRNLLIIMAIAYVANYIYLLCNYTSPLRHLVLIEACFCLAFAKIINDIIKTHK